MKKTPTKVKEVITALSNLLTEQYKKTLKQCDEEDLITYHDTLGRTIRNEFGLWQGNVTLLKDCLRIQRTKYRSDYDYCKKFYQQNNLKIKRIHPDDASMVIIREFKRKLK